MRSSPDVATEAARAKVTALEAAISALGSADEGALKSLHEALQKAKQSTHVPPVGERLDACHQFIERAKNRLAKADENLLKLQTERTQLATELAEGQARFEALRAEAGAVPPSPGVPKDVNSELQRMQGVIDELLRERSEWMVARQGEVKIPMDVGTLVDTRSARMEALIDDAGSKRPRVEGRSRRSSAQYGLRGTRVGEASHPGPSFLRFAARHQCCGRIASRGRFRPVQCSR